MTTQQKFDAVVAVLKALLETVQECGDQGAPAGVMYAALMDKMSLDQFQHLMGILVQAGRVNCVHHVYYAKDR
jgi:hypothetical protein